RFERDDLAVARQNDLWLVIHSESQVEALAGLPEGPALSVWLKIDTGMGRLGVAPARARRVIARLQACAAVAPRIVLM
ncbi:MAG: alanine racemase, partial [Gammaproteobacteria bacterium]|nr:alanine racemase [Gammaproteobacteria bacterium]